MKNSVKKLCLLPASFLRAPYADHGPWRGAQQYKAML